MQSDSMNVIIRQATSSDIAHWLEMRSQLWPPDADDDFAAEVRYIIEVPDQTAFVALVDSNYAGFVEISIRAYADGCKTNNVGYLEGIFVNPEFRRQGISRLLVAECIKWFEKQGCTEMASDAEIDNEISIKMHEALGFQSLKPIIQFTRVLKS